MNKKSKSNKGKRVALSVLCVFLALILTLMLGVTVYAEYLLNKLNYVDRDSTYPSLSQEEIDAIQNGDGETLDPDFTGPSLTGDEIEWGEVTTQIGNTDNIVNILLIGQDRRPGEGRARSDSMILITINKSKKTLTMTSFMRDLYVQIPGGYMDNRINTAYNLGGMELLNNTLEANFGIHVDANVEVDFTQFQDIIDLLGGVTINLSSAEASYINNKVPGSSLREGEQKLSGAEALWYARTRKVKGDGGSDDFGRTNRQRTVLNALIQEYKNKSLSEMLVLLEKILPMITTDLTKSEIVSYTTELFPLLADCKVVTQRIPVDGGYYNASIRGMSVLVPYMDVNRQALIDSLSDD